MAVVDPSLRVRGIGESAGNRRIDHAGDRERQHQCTDRDDRGKGRRSDPLGAMIRSGGGLRRHRRGSAATASTRQDAARARPRPARNGCGRAPWRNRAPGRPVRAATTCRAAPLRSPRRRCCRSPSPAGRRRRRRYRQTVDGWFRRSPWRGRNRHRRARSRIPRRPDGRSGHGDRYWHVAVSAKTCSTRSPSACPNESLIDLK